MLAKSSQRKSFTASKVHRVWTVYLEIDASGTVKVAKRF